MKKIILFFIPLILFISLSSYGQNVQELGKRNGFKDINLATDINQYEGLEFLKEIDDEKFGKLQIYTRKDEHYTHIGPIKINGLYVTVYNGEVYLIQVIFDKDPKMYGGLKQAFGSPKFSPVTSDYYWQADSLKLIYRTYDKKQLEMIYHSFVIEWKLKDEKKDEIEDIASDF